MRSRRSESARRRTRTTQQAIPTSDRARVCAPSLMIAPRRQRRDPRRRDPRHRHQCAAPSRVLVSRPRSPRPTSALRQQLSPTIPTPSATAALSSESHSRRPVPTGHDQWQDHRFHRTVTDGWAYNRHYNTSQLAAAPSDPEQSDADPTSQPDEPQDDRSDDRSDELQVIPISRRES